MLALRARPKGPLAMGIHWAHDASVSVCSPEGVIFSVAEERITRLKHHFGFPRKAIETALDFCGITASDIQYLAFSSSNVFYPSHPTRAVVGLDGSRKSRVGHVDRDVSVWQRIWDDSNARLRAQLRRKRLEWKSRNGGGEFTRRHYLLQKEFLSDLGFMDERIAHYYVAHHRAHAASAFRLSGMEEACVVSIDGKGDGISATIYKGHPDGRMELLRSSRAEDSLGSFYQATTEALGFIPVDGEYKTMGLAALGNADGRRNPFAAIVRVEDGVFRSRLAWTFRDYNLANPTKQVPNPLLSVSQTEEFKKILETMEPKQFAFFAQEHCEENMLAYARDALRIAGSPNLAAAGGVMLNVKANARIRDDIVPGKFFVFPDAADSGLSSGAALEALYQEGHLKHPLAFMDPYVGHGYTEEELGETMKSFAGQRAAKLVDGMPGHIVDRLIEGKVIGTFQGRLEMGPRALGNRSVIADARSARCKDRINLMLKGREYFVPFAPIVLDSDVGLYWEGHADYPFMTFAVNANARAKEAVPGVVHVDGTMRPQVVTEAGNPWLYQLLREYKKRTGIGVLINTSFNRHGLPIVGAPADALEHLENKWIDGLVMGSHYIEIP